jgi:hypothetical protein
MGRGFVTLGLAVAVVAAAVGIHAQQQSVGGNGPVKPPALLKQFVVGGRWRSQRNIGSLTDAANDSMNQ